MRLSPFHAYYKARTLETLSGRDRLVSAYASSNLEIYPYQIAAATFALRSPYLKGAILCDDGSLGKSIEAMLIITQRWYEGRHRILIVVPTSLLYQWVKIIDGQFSIPLFSIDNSSVFQEQIHSGNDNPLAQDGVVITTYDFAAEKAEFISRLSWDLTVFEEAHHLRRIYSGENKSASTIREAVRGSFKLLLTATPMQNDIMDLYGLIYFIDETALHDADSFYKRYFRKPENYTELAERVSKFCFRTTRPQVATYVKIPKRIPMTVDYPLSDKEAELAALVDAYLQKPDKQAFPKMDSYDLTLMMSRAVSSSPFAIAGLADRAYSRVRESELLELATLASDIAPENSGKGRELLKILKHAFSELKKRGANRKAIIFTENLSTLGFLHVLLSDTYKTLAFSGGQSRDYTIIERFEKEAEILIATDIAAEGFNLEFCSLVINYDLPYNTLTIEQRIGRCHRQGQQSDVIVVNFLSRNNFADVRMLELINKRILQYDGIIGLSDDVLGKLDTDIDRDFDEILSAARTRDEIDRAFSETLERHEIDNKRLVKTAEQSLFTSFSKGISDSVTVSPQYIKQRIGEISTDLWALTKYFFDDFNTNYPDNGFDIDKQTQTITARNELPTLFYYWTGGRSKPYQSLQRYGLAQSFKPTSGRITLASVVGRGVLQETACADRGTVMVDADIEPCVIGLYCVEVHGAGTSEYVVFAGKTDSGKTLTHDECCVIMEAPVATFTESGTRKTRWLRGSTGCGAPHELDRLIAPDEYIRRSISETDNAVREEIKRLKNTSQDKKISLERGIDVLCAEVSVLESGLDQASSIAEKVQAEKRKATVQKELKQREQQLFLDGMRLDLELEEQIKRLTDEAKFVVKIKRQFVIEVRGTE